MPHIISTIMIAFLLSIMSISSVYASGFSWQYQDLTNPNHLYENQEIDAILKISLTNGIVTTPAIVEDVIENNWDINKGAIYERMTRAAANATADTPVLIPVNLGAAHWVAMVVTRNTAGEYVVIYNNPIKGPMDAKVQAIIARYLPGAITYDLQVGLQKDSTTCGGYTTETLLALGNIANIGTKTAAELKAVVSALNTDPMWIRNKHFALVNGLSIPDIEKEIIVAGSNQFLLTYDGLNYNADSVEDIVFGRLSADTVGLFAGGFSNIVDDVSYKSKGYGFIGGWKFAFSEEFKSAIAYSYDKVDISYTDVSNTYSAWAHSINFYNDFFSEDIGVGAVLGGKYGKLSVKSSDFSDEIASGSVKRITGGLYGRFGEYNISPKLYISYNSMIIDQDDSNKSSGWTIRPLVSAGQEFNLGGDALVKPEVHAGVRYDISALRSDNDLTFDAGISIGVRFLESANASFGYSANFKEGFLLHKFNGGVAIAF